MSTRLSSLQKSERMRVPLATMSASPRICPKVPEPERTGHEEGRAGTKTGRQGWGQGERETQKSVSSLLPFSKSFTNTLTNFPRHWMITIFKHTARWKAFEVNSREHT